MIEFKADCGHTVRARDEDAGGVVRCSYCGRGAQVPDDGTSELDFLFREVEESAQLDDRTNRRRKFGRGRKKKARKAGGTSGADALGIVMKFAYVVGLIVVVTFVARKWVMPMFDSSARQERFTKGASASPPAETRQDTETRRSGRGGLLRGGRSGGLFIHSTPPGAEVFWILEDNAPSRGRISKVKGVNRSSASTTFHRVADGSYVVEVAFPWNDPSLSGPSLPDYSEYLEFRRAVEDASDAERRRLVEEYFIPDEASDSFIAETDDQIYIVKQYRGVDVRGGMGRAVRSLFLPRIEEGDGGRFSVEALLDGYVPNTKLYGFDETHVRNELNYYEVPSSAQPFLIEALERTGVIPYVTPDGNTRLFKVDIVDGRLSMRVIREAGS